MSIGIKSVKILGKNQLEIEWGHWVSSPVMPGHVWDDVLLPELAKAKVAPYALTNVRHNELPRQMDTPERSQATKLLLGGGIQNLWEGPQKYLNIGENDLKRLKQSVTPTKLCWPIDCALFPSWKNFRKSCVDTEWGRMDRETVFSLWPRDIMTQQKSCFCLMITSLKLAQYNHLSLWELKLQQQTPTTHQCLSYYLKSPFGLQGKSSLEKERDDDYTDSSPQGKTVLEVNQLVRDAKKMSGRCRHQWHVYRRLWKPVAKCLTQACSVPF